MAKLVSKTYGEALFELAMEENKADSFLEETEGIRSVLKQYPDFDKLMKHPGVPKQEKIAAMENVFKGRISDEMVGFLQVVITKERYGELQNIFSYFANRVKEMNKIGVAFVTTAVELDSAQQKAVLNKLLETTPYLTMEIKYQVDPSIIGGMIIRIKDRVVDSSIRTKLNDITKQLIKIQLG